MNVYYLISTKSSQALRSLPIVQRQRRRISPMMSLSRRQFLENSEVTNDHQDLHPRPSSEITQKEVPLNINNLKYSFNTIFFNAYHFFIIISFRMSYLGIKMQYQIRCQKLNLWNYSKTYKCCKKRNPLKKELALL